MKAPLLLSVLLLAGTSHAFADPIVSIVPETQNIAVGKTFTVDINVGNVADLYDYQFSLAFNPQALQADSITEGSLFANTGNSFFSPGTIDNNAGSLALTADTLFSFGPGVTGPGTIATAEFTALANGTSSIDFSPSSDLIFQDSLGNMLNVTTQSGDVTVGASPVPEPSTMGLLLIALAFLGWLHQTSKSSAKEFVSSVGGCK